MLARSTCSALLLHYDTRACAGVPAVIAAAHALSIFARSCDAVCLRRVQTLRTLFYVKIGATEHPLLCRTRMPGMDRLLFGQVRGCLCTTRAAHVTRPVALD